MLNLPLPRAIAASRWLDAYKKKLKVDINKNEILLKSLNKGRKRKRGLNVREVYDEIREKPLI